MHSEPWMDAILQALLFLELSDEETVDGDAAVSVIEQIAATLQTLDASIKQQFCLYLQHRAQQTASDPERKVIENMVEYLGLGAD